MIKKITFILNGYATRVAGTSGGEEHCLLLADYVYKNGYVTEIICPKMYPNLGRVKATNLQTYPNLPKEEVFYSFYPVLFFLYCYRLVMSSIRLRKIRTDLIVASSHLFHDVLPTYLTKNDASYMTYVHHIISEQKRSGLSFVITSFLEKLSFSVLKKRGYLVFVDSDRIKITLEKKYGFLAKNVYVTKNGVDLDLINHIRIPNTPTYDLCFCGRLSKAKGIFDLLRIVEAVKKGVPNVRCAVMGAGKEKERAIEEIKRTSLEKNIEFLGFVNEQKKIETIKSSKVFVLPSHEEGWGIVIGEALASGVPVVVYRLKDIESIWDDNVIWVNCFDTAVFAKTVTQLLEDPKQRETIAKKGLLFAKTLSWVNILGNELGIMEKVVK